MTDARSDYDKRMDTLALRIGKLVEGEKVAEVVFACGGVMVGCLMQLPPAIRREVWAKTIEFVAKQADIDAG